VTDIQLTPDAMRQAAPALAATIMETLRTAVAEAVRRQASIVDESVGAAFGLNTVDQVGQAQAGALGTATEAGKGLGGEALDEANEDGPILNESSIGGDQSAADTRRNLDI
jgi:hypothetical protein